MADVFILLEQRRLRRIASDLARVIERTEAGRRIYVDADFNWNKDTSRYKAQIIEVVNKISRENKDCLSLDTWSVGLISPRNKPKDSVFLVACNTAAGMAPIKFKTTDAANGRSFEAVKPIEMLSAIRQCREAAQDRATHPSTVSFSARDYSTRFDAKWRHFVIDSGFFTRLVYDGV